MARLENLGDHPPAGPVPHGRVGNLEIGGLEYLACLHEHAEWAVPGELLVDRVNLWHIHVTDLDQGPSWLTLQPNTELVNWKQILVDELGIDDRAIQSFVALVREGPLGYQEACRVLHHLLKENFESQWSRCAQCVPGGPRGHQERF